MRKALLAGILIISLSACEKEVVKMEELNGDKLGVSTQLLEFGDKKDELSFRLKNKTGKNVKWEIKNSNSWLSFQKRTGVMDSAITVKAKVNRKGVLRGTYQDYIIVSFPNNVNRVVRADMNVANISPTAPILLNSPNNGNPGFKNEYGFVRNPTFKWKASSDADRDSISYGVYIDKEENPKTLIKTIRERDHLKEYSFKTEDKLEYGTKYFAKIVAKDKYGGATSSEVVGFKTAEAGKFWHRIGEINHPLAKGNSDNRMTVHNGQLYYLSGGTGATVYNYVLRSGDGKSWNQVGKLNGGQRRLGSEMISFKGKLFLIGGRIYSSRKSDILSSTDGGNWESVAQIPELAKAKSFRCVVFKNKIWLFYSIDRRGVKILNSENGTDWKPVSDKGPTIYRDTELLIHNENLWLLGAGTFERKSGIFSSPDGKTWTHKAKKYTIGETGMRAISYKGKLWKIGGGLDRLNQLGRKLHVSENGIDWVERNEDMGFYFNGGEAVVFKKSIFAVDRVNVWRMD
ncbi:hypothetical protein FUAX_43110 (plasmid) [Fulvitalea axinellae]|uniref:BACON domain-containing protein n=1 Tax=Fulvitalea axinellae TaxID=1182444 RepID=A0AAU9CIB5_9BACT|nr:hypothetical protein FUAX_43110 [Fulvitalea axinellae]